MKHLEIVEIKNEYIERLRKTFPHIMINKGDYNTHTRKYIGIVFETKHYSYYAPFSSPKNYDYNIDKSPKQHTYFVLRMIDPDNKIKLIGKIIMNCMIPVSYKYIKRINVDYIKDNKYKELLKREIEWIAKNSSIIKQTANQTYNVRNSDLVLPFKKIEKFLKKHY